MVAKCTIFTLVLSFVFVRGDEANGTTATAIICLENCICDDVNTFLSDGGDIKIIGDNETLTAATDDKVLSERVTGSTVLQELRDEYHLYLAGYAIVCPRHDFNTLPALGFRNTTANGDDDDSEGVESSSISVLMLRCGLLVAITSENLPENLQIADFSHNRIRFIARDAMRKLRSLEILNLQYNLLTNVASHSDGFLRIPIPGQRLPVILLEGNPLICSCSLFTIITQHIGKDKGSCWLRNDENFNSSGRDKSAPAVSLPLHFFTYISSELARFCFDPQTSFKRFIQSQQENLNKYSNIHEDSKETELLLNRTILSQERRLRTIDYPLLITMSGWFLMVFIGLYKFVRNNSIDYERHKHYLSELDEQENSVIGPVPGNKRSRSRSRRTRRLISTDSRLSLL